MLDLPYVTMLVDVLLINFWDSLHINAPYGCAVISALNDFISTQVLLSHLCLHILLKNFKIERLNKTVDSRFPSRVSKVSDWNLLLSASKECITDTFQSGGQ